MALAALALVPVALALPRGAAFTRAVSRLLGAGDWAVVICAGTVGQGDGRPGRRNSDGDGLVASHRLIASIGAPPEAVRGTPGKGRELGFQRGEPCLESCLKGLTCAAYPGADDANGGPARGAPVRRMRQW